MMQNNSNKSVTIIISLRNFRYNYLYKSLFTKLVVAKKRKTYIHINTVKSNKTKQNTASKYATLL